MEKKEPYAAQEECDQHVVKYAETPLMQLNPGAKNYIVSSERMTVSFVTLEPDIRITPHSHEPEQICIVLGGACDFNIAGRLYHCEEGDCCIIPSNVEHGNYSSERGLFMIEVFSPPRADMIEKQRALRR
jgi:quercetin dioxygenase-like cupin family protein